MPQQGEPPLSPQTILWLQTTVGNRAVQRLLARRAAEQAKEQQLLVIAVEPRELNFAPKPMPPATLDHWTWWHRILRFFFRQWMKRAHD
jgi:hypothetical protein